ncbi:MAG: hypothetical protein JNM79_12995 [Burkholderiales bacterium]|nr:hypothetical protein [Burkholderiales bacterium]
MRIDGTFEIQASREAVYERLIDTALMARCVPGCESVEQLDPVCYKALVVVGLGGINARFNLVVEITEQQRPERIISRTRGQEGSRASMLAADNFVTLEALPGPATRIAWASEVLVTGRLGKFALGVMKKKVESLGNEFAQRLRDSIKIDPPRETSSAPVASEETQSVGEVGQIQAEPPKDAQSIQPGGPELGQAQEVGPIQAEPPKDAQSIQPGGPEHGLAQEVGLIQAEPPKDAQSIQPGAPEHGLATEVEPIPVEQPNDKQLIQPGSAAHGQAQDR